jgi:hypothetical protein
VNHSVCRRNRSVCRRSDALWRRNRLTVHVCLLELYRNSGKLEALSAGNVGILPALAGWKPALQAARQPQRAPRFPTPQKSAWYARLPPPHTTHRPQFGFTESRHDYYRAAQRSLGRCRPDIIAGRRYIRTAIVCHDCRLLPLISASSPNIVLLFSLAALWSVGLVYLTVMA